MAKGNVAGSVADAQKVLVMWAVNASFSMGDVTQAILQAAVTALQASDRAVEEARTHLTALVSARDDQQKLIDEYVTRARSSARGQFGPDSIQYEQAGGTRLSERKPARRKSKAT